MAHCELLTLSGKLDFLQKDRLFLFIRMLPPDTDSIVLDFKGIDGIDSSGIGLLLSARALLKTPLKNKVFLQGCSDELYQSLTSCGLHLKFPILTSTMSVTNAELKTR